VLLHVKCCKVERGQPCDYPGCTQARNLLDHYRKCRETRLAAAQQKSGQTCRSVARKADSSAAPPSCLVCSIMARHVRSVLENGPSHAPVPLVAKMPTSAGPQQPVVQPGRLQRNDSAVFMPPPPPRRPRSTSAPSLQEARSQNVPVMMTATSQRRERSASQSSLYRGRSSSDGVLCDLATSHCETILEEPAAEAA